MGGHAYRKGFAVDFGFTEEQLMLQDVARRIAQEKILGIPERLKKVAEYVESKSGSKTFSFELVFHREFAME